VAPLALIDLNQPFLGHTRAFDHMKELWAGGRLHPCWLLVGQRGIGKATFAHHLAVDVLMQGPLNPQGMPKAVVQRQMAVGSYPNFVHIQRLRDEKDTSLLAADISIEQIRSLKQNLALAAPIPGWRVVVIDAADELNTPSANALLKMLEEPPAQTLMLLIAHSFGQVLPTIRSRCMRLNLKPLGVEDYTPHGGAFDVALHTLCDGNMAMYSWLTQSGGLTFVEEIETLIDGCAGGRVPTYKDKIQTMAKDSKENRDNLLALMLHLITQKALQGGGARWVETWKASNQFLTVAKNSHLDTLHLLTTLCLLIENPHRQDTYAC
jgi:DNA polymerase-3 subunit delta'